VLTANPYDEPDVERAMAATPDLTNLTPNYVKAMAYDFHTLAGYLREQRDDPVIIVIGDHQPPAAVSGREATWRVPVHVITRRRHILQGLIEHGFHQGLEPQRPALGPMHALVPVLLDVFDAPAPQATRRSTDPGAVPPHFDARYGRRVPPTASASSAPSTGGP
jgi:hypothetical protein